MSAKSEIVLTVPTELVRGCKGLSIDMGGSVLKFAYRSKEDLDKATQASSRFGQLHLVSFPRSELREAFDFVRHHAHISRIDDEESPIIYTTGVGCTEFDKLICETFNIKIQNITEFDCFVKSFVYLAAHLPRSELLHPFIVEATEQPIAWAKVQIEMSKAMSVKNLTHAFHVDHDAIQQFISVATGQPPASVMQSTSPLAETESDMYPCVLAMCGSGFGYMKIEKDGSFRVVDGSSRGGKAFLGIGQLLTGCENFSELFELASHGDARNLDQYTGELMGNPETGGSESESVYTMNRDLDNTLLVYSFGKAVGKKPGHFSREDLARAWLEYVIHDMTQSLQYVCLANGVRRVFFCGSFVNEPLIRNIITTELVRRNLLLAFFTPGGSVLQFDFIKPGSHLGALGCLVNGVEKLVE